MQKDVFYTLDLSTLQKQGVSLKEPCSESGCVYILERPLKTCPYPRSQGAPLRHVLRAKAA